VKLALFYNLNFTKVYINFWSLVLGGRLCAGAFRRNLAPVVYVTPNFPCKEKLYTFRTFNAICKENVAIDGNTV
jgi:hypothetical protein